MSSKVPYTSDPVTANHYEAWMAAHQVAVDAHQLHADSEAKLMEQVPDQHDY